MGEEASDEDTIETRALRRQQADREAAERDEAGTASTDEAAETHARRADKAEYLKQKIEERARAEREAARDDTSAG